MGSAGVRLPLLLVLLGIQVWSGRCEESRSSGQCQPGFISDIFVFFVNRDEIANGRTLGKVHFDDCRGRMTAVYTADNSHIRVKPDGTVTVKRHMKLHDGLKIFTVTALDCKGKKFSTSVAVLNEQHEYGNYYGNDDHRHHHHHHGKHHRQHHNNTEKAVPTLEFPRLRPGRHRWKRDWVIPPSNVPENDRGPFPKKLVHVKSSEANLKKVLYSVTGNGADQPPIGLFTINRDTGILLVTKPLDRETQEIYTLTVYAVSSDGEWVEDPMDLSIHVIDQNDNKPVFIQQVFQGYVPEGVPPGTSVMTVKATDADDPSTDNALLGYSILSQEPKLQDSDTIFTISKETGVISTVASGLDKEGVQTYTLILQVADMGGNGLTNTATAIISVTDTNDNAPQFDSSRYEGSAPENKAGYEITRLRVTDKDEAHTPAWTAVYRIIKGNEVGLFNITADRESNQGILRTVKELDFETANEHVLLVTVENLVPFSVSNVQTSTTTVAVYVQDQNEAPIFSPVEIVVEISEDLPVGQMITSYPAKDPDKAQNQVIKYKIGSDPANWLEVDPETGIIRSKAQLDRESELVDKNNRYKALILAYDNGNPSATGSGTLVLVLQDVNDNAPDLENRVFEICNENPISASLAITDRDLPPHTSPFTATLVMNSDKNWTAERQDNNVILNMKYKLDPGKQNINLQLTDTGGKSQTLTVEAVVCECSGDHTRCSEKMGYVAGISLPAILAIIGAILLLLILVLLLLLFLRRRKKKVKEPPLLPDDNVRGNVYYYDEEGGGEDDQEYDLSQLHRGLDSRPEVIRNDVIPTLLPSPQYRPRPSNPDEIVNFIDENLKAADNDPTAPPYDSLLVFDYEGASSEVGSLSSFNSSSSGDQDYEYLNNWGPRFKKLADMYRGEDD
ncbi:B-cadherin-like [Protopterus annectens]|uniref:B-cadherin-like n=1 Tax=Protopterus annectens TaxID=7888 RepID=UPI001CFAC81C|nr:B-cadherin-like [Protopterus annectens]